MSERMEMSQHRKDAADALRQLFKNAPEEAWTELIDHGILHKALFVFLADTEKIHNVRELFPALKNIGNRNEDNPNQPINYFAIINPDGTIAGLGRQTGGNETSTVELTPPPEPGLDGDMVITAITIIISNQETMCAFQVRDQNDNDIPMVLRDGHPLQLSGIDLDELYSHVTRQ